MRKRCLSLWFLLLPCIAWLLSMVLQIFGAGREALEEGTMLLAAAVLFCLPYWLISKSEAARWQAFIYAQIDSTLSRGRVLALGLTIAWWWSRRRRTAVGVEP